MILGVDYASVDGNKMPDWTKAKQAGVRFAIIRGTYGLWKDPTLQRDWDSARRAGIIRGAYMFPVYSGDPTKEAIAFCDAVGPLGPGDLPPTLDIEFPGHGIADTRMSPAQAVAWLTAAAEVLQKRYGCFMAYTSGRVWHEDLRDAVSPYFRRALLWLARYTYKTRMDPVLDRPLLPGVVPPQLGDKDDYWIQQFQGDALRFDGFTNTVDLNIFRTLERGAVGERVGWLRARLGLPVLDKNGDQSANVFDAEVEDAVETLQATRGLLVDGIVGPKTFTHACWRNTTHA